MRNLLIFAGSSSRRDHLKILIPMGSMIIGSIKVNDKGNGLESFGTSHTVVLSCDYLSHESA